MLRAHRHTSILRNRSVKNVTKNLIRLDFWHSHPQTLTLTHIYTGFHNKCVGHVFLCRSKCAYLILIHIIISLVPSRRSRLNAIRILLGRKTIHSENDYNMVDLLNLFIHIYYHHELYTVLAIFVDQLN